MTTIFLEINNDSYLLEHLTYNSETKVFTVFTERVGDWEELTSSVPKNQSTILLLKTSTLTRHPETQRV